MLTVPANAPLRRVIGQDHRGDVLECGHAVDPAVRGHARSHRCHACKTEAALAAAGTFGGLRLVDQRSDHE